MEIAENLKTALKLESENLKINSLKVNAVGISENYRKTIKKSISNKKDVLAYALSRMPATYCAVYNSIKQTINNITILPKTMVDIGAGTGSATFAVNELLNLENITCLEYETEMLNLGQKLVSCDDKLSKLTTWEKFDLLKNKEIPTADLLISSYVLNELPEEVHIKIVDKLWKSTNNLLIIVEPGTPKNFEQIKKIRNFLIEQGANLIGPCTHKKECPIINGDWCHFTVRVERSKIHKMLKNGDSPFEDEKFTYLAFSKLESVQAKARVLRHPQFMPKVVTLKLCQNDGKICTVKIPKSNINYKIARDIKVGDQFPS